MLQYTFKIYLEFEKDILGYLQETLKTEVLPIGYNQLCWILTSMFSRDKETRAVRCGTWELACVSSTCHSKYQDSRWPGFPACPTLAPSSSCFLQNSHRVTHGFNASVQFHFAVGLVSELTVWGYFLPSESIIWRVCIESRPTLLPTPLESNFLHSVELQKAVLSGKTISSPGHPQWGRAHPWVGQR